MRYYPIGLDLKDQPVLLVGAGGIAARKCERLLRAGAVVRVVALTARPVFLEWAAQGRVELALRAFSAQDLREARLVIAATHSRAVNAQVSALARRLRVPVNVVDDPELSSAVLPALVERGPLQIAIATNGIAPALASWLRLKLESWLDPALGPLLTRLGAWRERLRTREPDPMQRRSLYRAALAEPVLAAARRGDADGIDQALAEIVAGHQPRAGRVVLVGAGPGDPRFLTLAALQALGDADVVFHDSLIDPAVLRHVRADAEIVAVGKRCGLPSVPQPSIEALLIEAARQGKQVVRLKGGDPLVFARGGEELLALRQAGIEAVVIPGITAAHAAAAAAGIPLTHRGLARGLRLVTAHSREGLTSFELLRRRPDETLAIYMGAQRAEALLAELRRAGIAERTPVAFVEAASRPEQRVLYGHLAQLVDLAAQLDSRLPSLLLIGEVCALGKEALRPDSESEASAAAGLQESRLRLASA